jgi:ABC-type sugar transport system ATPase subunit
VPAEPTNNGATADAGGEQLLLAGVRKTYGPATVLDVDHLELRGGQVVCLLGENGAGKSTMMGVVAGSVEPDTGTVTLGGESLLRGTLHSQELGVAMVSQEFPLVGQLTVAENLMLGRRASGRRLFVDNRAMHAAARALLDDIGLDVSTRRRVDSLSVAQRQLLEIAKALGRNPRVLILDEPTSALGPAESEHVLQLARDHAATGGIVIFVGHRLNEVRAVGDRMVVLRNGRVVADLTSEEATEQRLVREMVGKELEGLVEVSAAENAASVFSARGLRTDNFGPVDLDVHAGEIVGVAGLMGSGRSTLLHVIMGAHSATGGEMTIDGRRYRPHSTSDGVAAGIGLVPEDRKAQALLLDAPIRWNITLAILRRISSQRLFLKRRAERRTAVEMVRIANVVCQSPEQPARSLSGGNQQRMIFGRWMAARPKLLLLDEPTRGVDVGAKAEIYKLIEEEREKGMAILVVSSELEELLGICHRIVVMKHGRVTSGFERASFSKERIIAAAAFGAQA